MNVFVGRRVRHYRTVSFDPRRNEVLLIEQQLLTHQFQIVPTRSFRETARALHEMVVRGAGAIGATAAFGFAQGLRAFRGRDLKGFQRHTERVYRCLKAARPTAVDPVNAMDQVRAAMAQGRTVSEQQETALNAAQQFADENLAQCEAIGRHGASLIRDNMRILTHCNAGWLAFVDVGSATAPLQLAPLKVAGTFSRACATLATLKVATWRSNIATPPAMWIAFRS